MRARNKLIRKGGSEAGIALLIAIFVLLLISVVAIALIFSSGTESALAGNYRSATSVYYAALAGLEEGRGRLLAKNPNSFKTTNPGFLPSPLAVGSPLYIINPAGGENVAPWDQGSTYPDTEYQSEFNGVNPPNPSPSANSVSGVGGVQGPLYKWVRINAVSEQSLKLDTYPFDGTLDQTTPVFYDSQQKRLNSNGTGAQVLEITSLAVLPNGSRKLLQYLVTLVPVKFPDFPTGQLSFPSALTLSGSTGSGAAFHAPDSNFSYAVKGNDQDCSGALTGSKIPAIGVFTGADVTSVINGIPSAFRPNYTGAMSPAPDVEDISSVFPASLQTPSKLDALAQLIVQNADVIIPSGPVTYPLPTVTGSALTAATSGMSSSNPMTVVVSGDLDLTSWHNTGYGLLVVTGNLNYDPDASWDGIVLVIGAGTVTGSKGGNGEFDGAFLVAKTRDSSGNLLPDPNLGTASVIFNSNMGGVGIRYSSCWIKASLPSAGYRILSFHEIPQ